jgi:methionyl aminopeptidase
MAPPGFLRSLLDALRGKRAEPPSPSEARIEGGDDHPYRAPDAPLVDPLEDRLPLPLAVQPTDPQTRTEWSAWLAPAVGEMMVALGAALRPGMRTIEIEELAHRLLEKRELLSAMKNYNAFPSAVAVSIDHELMHGIPNESRIIERNSLVKIQFGARTKSGGTANMGWTFAVGEPSPEAKAVRAAAIAGLQAGLAVIKDGARAGDLGAAIQAAIEGAGMSVVRDFVGYGFGEKMMMDPQLKCFGKPRLGVRLRAGMLLHVHSIAAAGGWEVEIGDDRWTVSTVDRKPAALATALVRVLPDGAELLAPLVARA